MLVVRSGRTAPLRVQVGLLLQLACALATAGPNFVAPDEEASLRPVVATDRAVGWASAHHRTSFDPSLPRDVGWASAHHSSVAGIDLVDGRLLPEPFAPPRADSPPVLRLQSPDFDLIPLATGATPLEQTSILRSLTGTKGRLRGDYLTDFDDTDRIGVQALTQGWLGLGFDAEANYWQRPVAGIGREPLWTGDLNLIYNFKPHPRFKFRSGAGTAWKLDDGTPHAGYNVTHGLDVYLLWRFMAVGEIDWGQMDDDELFRYRLALGLTFKSAEFYSGYESWKLGSERLDGWVNGVAIWY